jgi:hypothetical protein
LRLPREVKIRIRPDGKVEIETEGFVGKSCAEVAGFLERLLAGEQPDADDVQHEFKAEYYLADVERKLDLEDRNR